MIEAIVALAVIAVAQSFLIYTMLRDARAERSELITRIQRPEWIPPAVVPAMEPWVPEPDDFPLVGQVILGDVDADD